MTSWLQSTWEKFPARVPADGGSPEDEGSDEDVLDEEGLMTAASCWSVPDGRILVEEERKDDEDGAKDAAVVDDEGIVAALPGIQQQQRMAMVYTACMLPNVKICIKRYNVSYGMKSKELTREIYQVLMGV